MAQDQPQICGAVDEIEYGVWFECELPIHHPGDEHQAVHVWQNEPHGPKPAPAPNRFLPAAWADALLREQQLVAAVHGSPFVNPDTAVRQVVNRDLGH